MRKLIAFIVGVICISIIIFYIDPKIINWAILQFPISAKDWLGIIEIALWFIILWLSFGISVLISATIGIIVGFFIPVKVPDDEGRSAMYSTKKRSLFRERLDEAQRKRNNLK